MSMTTYIELVHNENNMLVLFLTAYLFEQILLYILGEGNFMKLQ